MIMQRYKITYGLTDQSLDSKIEEFKSLEEATETARMNAISVVDSSGLLSDFRDELSAKYDRFLTTAYYYDEVEKYITYYAQLIEEKPVKRKLISEVYDVECLSNLFTYTGYDRHEQKYYQFVIWRGQNDYEKFIEHLKRGNLIMTGYNNENYDYPLIHHMINHFEEYRFKNGKEIAEALYQKSQSLIDSNWNTVAEWNKHIKQIDLFKIHHYDNLAKLTSLKALQIALNLPEVEDMPYNHDYYIRTQEEVDEVLRYNKNDVFATNAFFDVTLGKTDLPNYKGKNKIEIRQRVAHKYGINCLNYNDIKLGIELILKLYSQKTGLNPRDVKQLRTHRAKINLGDCLPVWTNFSTKPFKSLVEKFKTATIINGSTKGVFSHSIIYNNFKIDYGTGGAHGAIKPGVYTSNEEYCILDLDISSMYPNLAIQQGITIEHLGKSFIEIYDKEIVSVRMNEKTKPKKDRDVVIMEGFKLSANGSYGKSNSEDSFLYDPLYTMKTTVSGQILISMWVEQVCESVECQIIQVNTDGYTIRLKRSESDKVFKISDDLMKLTGMEYEYVYYDKFVVRDVNNYSSRYEGGGIKHKGAFEIEKELHKDPSMKIVPIALEKYFFEGIPIEQTIKNHQNIYDFCLRLKLNSAFSAHIVYLNNINVNDSDDKKHEFLLMNGYKFINKLYYESKDNVIIDPKGLSLNDAYTKLVNGNLPSTVIKELSKNTRYFITNSGGSLIKTRNKDNWETRINSGFLVKDFNSFVDKPMNEYNLNYNFYIAECNKIIDLIEDKQLSLF